MPFYWIISPLVVVWARERKEKKIDFDPLPWPLFAEERNDSFTPRHFRFLLSATVLS